MKQETLRGDIEEMGQFQLGPSAELLSVAIRVKDRDKMIAFYRDIIGFSLKSEENALAIMGTDQHPEERFLLEESPRAQDYFGKTKKLHHLTLQVQSLAELAAIAARLAKVADQHYQIEVTDSVIEVKVVDPEENQWVICYQKKASDQVITSSEELVTEQTDASIRLAETIQFVSVALNVHDMEEEVAFLTTNMGLKNNSQEKTVHVPSVSFSVVANQVSDPTVKLASHEVIGLEFIKFRMDQKDLLALEENLVASSKDFFIDQKKTILTVYDSVGVEWWFEQSK
ncbi:CppA N-terminal domain-containing protein [Enterococcus camelliae]|uniref:CppA N-terminal domain-containing protein n=1 Tax=Enterococcus camelliae TaxID=453959 RepID=A0ABW5TIN4_9ENTE